MNTKILITIFMFVMTLNAILLADIPISQVEIEARIVETTRSFSRQLGINWSLVQPVGDFSDNVDMGMSLGVAAGVGVSDRVVAELGVDFGFLNSPNDNWSLNILSFNPVLNIYLKSLENEQAGNIISSPKVIVGTSFETAIGTSEYNDSKSRWANSGPGVLGGFDIPILETGNNVFSLGAKGRLALTDDSDDYIKMYLRMINSDLRRGASSGIVTQAGDLSYGAGLTIVQPTGDFASAGGPGVGILAKVSKQIKGNFGVAAGGGFVRHIKTGSLNADQGNSLTTINGFVDATLKLDVTPVISPSGVIRMDLTVARTKYNNISTSETGTVLMGGLLVREMITDNIGIEAFHGIPLVGELFSDSKAKSAKTELLIFITPRIVKSSEE